MKMHSTLYCLLSISSLALSAPQLVDLNNRFIPSGWESRIQKRCGENVAGWQPTPDNWNSSGTSAWLQQFISNNSNTGTPLWKALGDQYMPNDVSFDCQVGDTGLCSDTDCEQILQNSNDTNQKNPVFAIDAIIGLTQHSTTLWNSLQTATNVAGLLDQQNFVDLFTNSALFSPEQNIVIHELLSAISYLIYAALAFLGPIGIEGIAAAGISAFGTLMVGGVSEFSNTLSAPSESEVELQQMATIGKYLANMAGPVRNSFANTINTILSGGKDPAGNTFLDYADYGFFSNWRQNYANFTQSYSDNYMTNVVVAGSINALWKASLVYIVASPAQNGDCQNDNRISGVQKFCKDNDGWIYGIFAIDTTSDDYNHPGVMPWGLDKLDQIGANVSISASDVFDSSIKAYQAARFNYEMVRGYRWTQAFINAGGGGNSPSQLGADFEGVFTIPVCADFTGAAMSNGNHPCYCGENGSETGAFQAATGLDQNTNQYEYVGCKVDPGSSGNQCNFLTGCSGPNPLETQ